MDKQKDIKVGLLRCRQTENACMASKCLEFMRTNKGAFADIGEEITCVGVNICGGWPGRNAAGRAWRMVKQAAEATAISSCSIGMPNDFLCLFHKKIIWTVKAVVGGNIKVLEYTCQGEEIGFF